MGFSIRTNVCSLVGFMLELSKLGFHSSCDRNWFITSLLQIKKDYVTFLVFSFFRKQRVEMGTFFFFCNITLLSVVYLLCSSKLI
jgi:hypothetical protein